MTNDFTSRFLDVRRDYIVSRFPHLNPMQQEAVLQTDGPLLLLAGAGSGKTTVLINRIVNLGILYQYAFDYCDSHRQELARYKTVTEFDQSFHVTDAMFNELVSRAEKKNIKGNTLEKQVARRETNILLKAYIARDLFEEEGFYPIYRPMDDMLQKAIEALNQ